ncbi:MAG: carboxypeptidase-like regulatory domain-containing protein [Segetibacter sp.]
MKWKKDLPLVLFLLLSTTTLFAQHDVTGVVTDSAGSRLQSVSVSALKSSAVAVTDANGTFRISVPSNVSQLQFSIVGFQQQVINIAGKTEINVTMQSAAGALADVVVVGYGTQRKRDVTGTISSVKGEEFKNLPVSNAANALQGRASGVDIVRSDASPGSVPY